MQANTHREISRALCGEPVTLQPGSATVRLITTEAMIVDAEGLVHGGFVFGAADHAAMLAVDHPNVVLGAADVRFVAPVRLGDEVRATAKLVDAKGKKRVLEVVAAVGGAVVLRGTMTAFVLDRHVLTGR